MNPMLIIGIILGVLGIGGMFGVLMYGNKLYNQAEDKTAKIAMPVACKAILVITTILLVAGIGLGVFGAIQGGGNKNFEGTYISDDSSAVTVTAYEFKSDGTYRLGFYDKETKKYNWTSSGQYTISNSTITVKGGTFTIQNNGKKLYGSNGGYWVKVK